jgi:peptidoglycan-N-acetylglucosamine deacetylase
VKLLLAMALALGTLSSTPIRIVSSGTRHARSVALTFDAGADTGYAASILGTLERNRIHASFGMTGKWALANPNLVKRIARDHDVLMNHTYDHRSFTGLSTRLAPLSAAQRTWEIDQTERVVHRLTGRSTKPFFRPPYGDWDSATLTLANRLGYRYMVMWTLDSLGWDGLSTSQILQRCVNGVRPGTILLMHVGIQSHDAQALQPLIDNLKRRGYRFETMSQVVAER